MHLIWHTVLPGQFFCKFENKDPPFQIKVVSDVSYELWYCGDITVSNIQTEPCSLVQWHFDFIFWGL